MGCPLTVRKSVVKRVCMDQPGFSGRGTTIFKVPFCYSTSVLDKETRKIAISPPDYSRPTFAIATKARIHRSARYQEVRCPGAWGDSAAKGLWRLSGIGMDSRLRRNDGIGTGTDCSWREGIPGGRLNQALPDFGSSTPTAKAGKPQQQATAGFPPLFPSGFPKPQARARSVSSGLLIRNSGLIPRCRRVWLSCFGCTTVSQQVVDASQGRFAAYPTRSAAYGGRGRPHQRHRA